MLQASSITASHPCWDVCNPPCRAVTCPACVALLKWTSDAAASINMSGITNELTCRHAWEELGLELAKAERAVRLAQDGFAFSFVEGALTRAVRQGHWLLLDEINLGPPEVLFTLSSVTDCAKHATLSMPAALPPNRVPVLGRGL